MTLLDFHCHLKETAEARAVKGMSSATLKKGIKYVTFRQFDRRRERKASQVS
jgi:hypothetical protein